jgi:hypothetical protein
VLPILCSSCTVAQVLWNTLFDFAVACQQLWAAMHTRAPCCRSITCGEMEFALPGTAAHAEFQSQFGGNLLMLAT